MENNDSNNVPSIEGYGYDEATLEARSYFFHELPLSVSGEPVEELSPAQEQYLMLHSIYSEKIKETDQ